jgi:hypothetical protein
MVILGRGRRRPDGEGGRGARALETASRERQARPGDGRRRRGAGRVVGSVVGAATPGAGPRPALPIGLDSLARTPERAAVRSSTRGGPDRSPK